MLAKHGHYLPLGVHRFDRLASFVSVAFFSYCSQSPFTRGRRCCFVWVFDPFCPQKKKKITTNYLKVSRCLKKLRVSGNFPLVCGCLLLIFKLYSLVLSMNQMLT